MIGLFGLAFSGRAQTLNGKHLVGMQVGEIALSFRDLRGPVINLSPAYGVFIKPNLALGLELPFYYARSTSNQIYRRNTQVAVTPFVRYYFGESWVKPFASLLAGPRYSTLRQRMLTTATSRSESQIDFAYGARGGGGLFYQSLGQRRLVNKLYRTQTYTQQGFLYEYKRIRL